LKKRFGKATYPETSEAGDNLFGELKSLETKDGEPVFKKEYAFLTTDKIEKSEQAKFIGLKKDDVVEFNLETTIKDEEALAQLLGDEEPVSPKGQLTFKVTNISRTENSEVNQELFDRVFGKDAVTTEEEFLNKIRETISENYQREGQHFFEHLIQDYFVKNTNINLPDEFLKHWLKISSQGKIDDAVLTKEFEDYKRTLRWDLIKNKIAEDNNITVEADEVRAKAKELIISQFGGQAFADQIADRLDGITDNYLQHENGQNFMKLYNQLRGEKIVNFIKDKITIDEQNVTVDEFKKITSEHTH
jgi:trigger factor